MIQDVIATMRRLGMTLALTCTAGAAAADPTYGIAMIGAPALPPDFVSLPHANPDAPKGGRIVFGESGTFDTLNPFNAAGQPAAGLSSLTVETLMGRSYDEPFTLYGLLAESIDTDAERTYAAFTLRKEARFSDGSSVTVEDVLWSFEILGTIGNPRYAAAWKKIAKAEVTGPRTIRFTFTTADRELPLILGLRPILQKAQWQGRDFTATSLEAPIGSGPYMVGAFEAGRFISYKKNPDWWGAALPLNRGLHNLEEVRYEYFGASAAVFEAFKAGVLTSYREGNAAKWITNYDFPAVTAGDVVKSEIPHSRPTGIEGFAMNTRRPLFADWRVREALITAFNFELTNTTITGGSQKRITSYFANSSLGIAAGDAAEGAVLAALEPYRSDLLPGALDGYTLPAGDGTEANRANLRKAAALMEEAGWTVAEDGILKNANGDPFAFEILLVQGADEMASIAAIYVESLKRLGMDARITIVDSAQMKESTNTYDFDMTHYIRSVSLSPGTEQTLYWGSIGATEPGTRNWMGINSPAVDAMIAKLLVARTGEDLQTAAQALDRLLISGRYVVPLWYSPVSRLAHAKSLHYPDRLPLYGDWIGFQPDVWWYEE